jgi:hypothetical protein
MVEVGEVSLAAAERALRHAGFEPVVRDAPARFADGQPQPGAG